MDFYTRLTADQVASTYQLVKLLQRLRIIGRLIAHTESTVEEGGDIFGDYVIHDFGANYSIVKDGYTWDKGHIDAHELLERLFGRFKDQQLRGTD